MGLPPRPVACHRACRPQAARLARNAATLRRPSGPPCRLSGTETHTNRAAPRLRHPASSPRRPHPPHPPASRSSVCCAARQRSGVAPSCADAASRRACSSAASDWAPPGGGGWVRMCWGQEGGRPSCDFPAATVERQLARGRTLLRAAAPSRSRPSLSNPNHLQAFELLSLLPHAPLAGCDRALELRAHGAQRGVSATAAARPGLELVRPASAHHRAAGDAAAAAPPYPRPGPRGSDPHPLPPPAAHLCDLRPVLPQARGHVPPVALEALVVSCELRHALLQRRRVAVARWYRCRRCRPCFVARPVHMWRMLCCLPGRPAACRSHHVGSATSVPAVCETGHVRCGAPCLNDAAAQVVGGAATAALHVAGVCAAVHCPASTEEPTRTPAVGCCAAAGHLHGVPASLRRSLDRSPGALENPGSCGRQWVVQKRCMLAEEYGRSNKNTVHAPCAAQPFRSRAPGAHVSRWSRRRKTVVFL